MKTLEQYKQDQARISTETAAAKTAAENQTKQIQELEWRYTQLQRALVAEKKRRYSCHSDPRACY